MRTGHRLEPAVDAHHRLRGDLQVKVRALGLNNMPQRRVVIEHLARIGGSDRLA